ncbi:MAG: hypothetical protein HYV09_02655 [Deltaproteobacteria bacterium]|nr:hypothetical protein [Deltaproteobacteria bacterium]
MRDSLVSGTKAAGIAVYGRPATIERCEVRDVAPDRAGKFGDGVIIQGASGALRLEGSVVEGCARAGVSVFGASLTIGASALRCNAIDLDVESRWVEATGIVEHEVSLIDSGGTVCGCGDALSRCHGRSAALEPLPPPPPLP